MPADVKAIPDGASVVIPRLVCRDPAAAIDFCVRTFGAVERGRRPGPDGTVAHAMMTIGPAMLMIEGEWPTLSSRAPQLDGSSPVVIYVYVENVDETLARALANGAPEDVAALYQNLRRAVRRIRGSQKLLWSCIYASDLPWTK